MRYFLIQKEDVTIDNKSELLYDSSEDLYNYIVANGHPDFDVIATPSELNVEVAKWYYDRNTQLPVIRSAMYFDQVWADIKVVRDRKLTEGFYSQLHWFSSEDGFKILLLQYQGILFSRKLASLPTNVNMQLDGKDVKIKSLDAGEITLTYDDLETMLNDLNLFAAKISNTALDKKESMKLLTDPRTINLESGYTPTFVSTGILEPASAVISQDVGV